MVTEYVETAQVPAATDQLFARCCTPDALPRLLTGVEYVRAVSFALSTWQTDLGGSADRVRVLLTDFRPARELAWRGDGSRGFWLHLRLVPLAPTATLVELRLRRAREIAAPRRRLLRFDQFARPSAPVR